MKKFTFLLLAILLLFSLSACEIDLPWGGTIQVPSITWYDAEVCYTGYSSDHSYWEYAYNNDKDAWVGMPIFKLESAGELADFKENLKPYFSFNAKRYATPDTFTLTFNEVTADYDDAFFAENIVLVVYVQASSGTFRYRVENATVKNNALIFTIDQYNDDGISTCDMSGWLAVISISREALDTNEIQSYHVQRSED